MKRILILFTVIASSCSNEVMKEVEVVYFDNTKEVITTSVNVYNDGRIRRGLKIINGCLVRPMKTNNYTLRCGVKKFKYIKK